jgi:FAD/FMN-containing dehydrogenase
MSSLLALLLPLCSTAVNSSTDQCLMQLRGTLIRHKLVESLEACLHAGAALVTAQGEQGYDEAKQCINQRPDIVPSPLAVVQVASVAEVQKAVSCAAAQGVQVCARAGGHGFDNDAGCSGGVVIDVRGLNSFSVDTETKVTTFGAGLCLGQLYYKLAQHGLLVPGGTVNGVGAAGLILGCGRGFRTQLNGLACDSLLAVQYVDASGEVRWADAGHHADMLWIAKGGGASFPGVVTEFVMQAYDMPNEVYTASCTFDREEAWAIAKGWFGHAEEMAKPEHKLFTTIQMWNNPATIEVVLTCFDCDSTEKDFQHGTLSNIAQSGWKGNCGEHHTVTRTWLQEILHESGYGILPFNVQGNDIEKGLLDCSNGWGKQGTLTASKNGGHMGYDWSASDRLLDDMVHWTQWDTPADPYGVLMSVYLMGGPLVQAHSLDSAAYGPRGAKWVIHYKHQWSPQDGQAKVVEMVDHHTNLSLALDKHLNCSHFYNYMGADLTCADTNDKWLAAHFSDVPRMKAIKAASDPLDTFRSRLTGHSTASTTASSTTGTCHTAVPGEECYGHAAWAHQEGIRSSPQWYPGLSLESSFEDFQEQLWTNGLYECERPCRQ